MSFAMVAAAGVGAAYSAYAANKSRQTLRAATGPINQQGTDTFNSGSDTAAGGLSGLQDWNTQLTNRLNSGRVLPDSVYKAYDSLRGGISDTAARDANSLGVNLAQGNAQSGGRMSPEALAELKMQGDQSINDQQFSSLQSVGQDQAHAELGQTNSLMDRIMAARQSILGAGQFQQQLGQQAQLAALTGKISNINQQLILAGQTAGDISRAGGGK